MAGWMVTVGAIRDDEKVGHEMYAVNIDDPEQAVQAALKASNSDAAVVNGPVDEASMMSIGLEPGGIVKVLDEQSDPLISGGKRH